MRFTTADRRAYAGGVLTAEPRFVPYGLSHWVLMALIIAGAVTLAVIGRTQRDATAARRFARGFALVMLAFLVSMQIYKLLPGEWDINNSLPLQFSDLAWIAAVYTLWTRQQWSYSLTYYWGLTLIPQAMITPALDAPDFPHIKFIDFWGQHLLVVWATAYLTWGVRMRPDWRSYRLAVAVTVCWGLALLVFNSWADSNYGFVNRKPDNPSLLDLMGGWPWYLAVEAVAGLIAWALVTWPWTRRARTASRTPADAKPHRPR